MNHRFGVFALLLATLRWAMAPTPRGFFRHLLSLPEIALGRIWWLLDCCFAPFERRSREQVVAMMTKHGSSEFGQFNRGSASDPIEEFGQVLLHAAVKYGEGQLELLASRRRAASTS